MKQIKQFLCKHDYKLERGYGLVSGKGMGSYDYKQCTKCHKIANKITNFKKDEEVSPSSKKHLSVIK
jgi:hypothetical protein